MCGRYYRKSDKQKIAEAFHASSVDDFPMPPWDHNVAPTTQQPIIRNHRDTGERIRRTGSDMEYEITYVSPDNTYTYVNIGIPRTNFERRSFRFTFLLSFDISRTSR